MPSVEELRPGQWRVRWRDAAGRRHGPGLTFPTATAARTYGLDREAEVRAGKHRDPRAGRILLRDFAEQWWSSYVAEPRTLTKVRSHLDLYILAGVGGADPLGDRPLERLDHMTVQGWVKRLERLPRAPATVAGIYRTLATITHAALRAQRISDDPCAGITLPTVPPVTDFYWERAEAAAIREQLTRPVDRAVFDLLLGAGVRWGELAGLHLPRWQPLRRRLSIVEVLEEEKGLRLKAYPKGKRRREVPVAEHVVDSLAAYLAECPPIDCGLVHAKKTACSGLVFHDDGRPLSRHVWPRTVLAPAVVAAKVRPGSPHALRHTYASWLVLDGVPLRVVQDLLGHASARTTERYSHLAPSALDDPRLLASLARSVGQSVGQKAGEG